jgi:predicted ATP-dependent endonuclease of OLD family
VKLQRFQVQKFRNIVDSGVINVQQDVTCLVGMNEAGKSAILTALARLNPARPDAFSVPDDYPRWLKNADQRKGVIGDVHPISATFLLGSHDKRKIEAAFGEGVLTSDEVTLSRLYDDKTLYWTISSDANRAVRNLVKKHDVPGSLAPDLSGAANLEALQRAASEARERLAENVDYTAEVEVLNRLLADLVALNIDSGLNKAIITLLRAPLFFYFSDYSILDGRIDLDRLAQAEGEREGSTSDQTARALLALANTTPGSLKGDDYEERKAELEAVSNELTDQVFTYWKQNEHLRVTFDLDRKIDQDGYGRPQVVQNVLDVRVQDTRHHFTNNFSQRSSGFRWFFSFLAAFTEFESRNDDFIVLLDEPALTLHGRAQNDFLRFVNERLATAAQVLYTTHSPFMVESDHLDRVRIVEDKGPKQGATVTQEVLSVRDDSAFPLQAALGYDLAQHLFIGDANLLVEGPSDLLYLDLIGRRLADEGGTPLHKDWRILTAGGAGNIPAFVTLLGSNLDVTVLIDSGTEGTGRLDRAMEAGRLKNDRLVSVQEITKRANSDIEDLFTETDYLRLYNAAFATSHKPDDLPNGDRIVERLSRLDWTVPDFSDTELGCQLVDVSVS